LNSIAKAPHRMEPARLDLLAGLALRVERLHLHLRGKTTTEPTGAVALDDAVDEGVLPFFDLIEPLDPTTIEIAERQEVHEVLESVEASRGEPFGQLGSDAAQDRRRQAARVARQWNDRRVHPGDHPRTSNTRRVGRQIGIGGGATRCRFARRTSTPARTSLLAPQVRLFPP